MNITKIIKLTNEFLNLLVKTSQEYITLYHINSHGKGAPKPCHARPEGSWHRYYLDEPIESGIFLSDDPVSVWKNHGIRGSVHVYNVSSAIISELGGLHNYDWAREIIIPEAVWNDGISSSDIIYLGKMSERKFEKKLKERSNSTRNNAQLSKSDDLNPVSVEEKIKDIIYLKIIKPIIQREEIDLEGLKLVCRILEKDELTFFQENFYRICREFLPDLFLNEQIIHDDAAVDAAKMHKIKKINAVYNLIKTIG